MTNCAAPEPGSAGQAGSAENTTGTGTTAMQASPGHDGQFDIVARLHAVYGHAAVSGLSEVTNDYRPRGR
jgi:hypothetical protein